MCTTRKSLLSKQTWVCRKTPQSYRLQMTKAQFCKAKLAGASLLPHYSLIWVELLVWTEDYKVWVISGKKPFLTKYLTEIAQWKNCDVAQVLMTNQNNLAQTFHSCFFFLHQQTYPNSENHTVLWIILLCQFFILSATFQTRCGLLLK